MISAEEKQYLHWIGNQAWQGKGLIVEIGPWLGGSTVCLAAGMQESGHQTDKRLVVYDNFIWREFMSDRAPLDLQPGDCFHHGFRENVSDYSSIVDSYKLTLPDEIIAGDKEAESKRFASEEKVPMLESVAGNEPVEILFVDGAKSWLALKHLLVTVSERLLAGDSLLVCQDYKYWGNYWVPLMVTLLGDRVRPVHNVLAATTVTLHVDKPVSRETLAEFPDHIAKLDTEKAVKAIDQAAMMLAEMGDRAGAANVELGKVMFLSHQDKVEQAKQCFCESQKNWPRGVATGQLERARKYLADSRGVHVSPGLIVQANRLIRKIARRILKPGRG